jgi:hypothetical protein
MHDPVIFMFTASIFFRHITEAGNHTELAAKNRSVKIECFLAITFKMQIRIQ